MNGSGLILRVGTRFLVPLLLVVSIFLLLRGHNEPGGGFVGGLVAAAAFALVLVADGPACARRVLRVEPLKLVATGLLTALGAGLVALAAGKPFLSGLWLKTPVPVIGKLGTPLVFDVGVYGVVVGITVAMFLALAEDSSVESLLAIVIGALYAAGLYLMMRRTLLRLVLGLALLAHAANLLIFTVAGLGGTNPPIVPPGAVVPEAPYADPVPQALILTAIVIGFGVQAFAVVLVRRVWEATRTDDLDCIQETDS